MNFRRIFLYAFAVVLCLSMGILLCSCMIQNSDIVNTLPPTAEPGPTPVPRDTENDTTLSASMVYAANAANQVDMRYDTADRQNLLVSNVDSVIGIRLKNSDVKGLDSLALKRGNVLIEGGMTGYVVKSDGTRYTTASSDTAGRINANKLGYYYYEVNIRDLHFGEAGGSSGDVDIMCRDRDSLSGNQIDNIEVKDGVISAKITNGVDPYLVMPVNAAIGEANLIKIEMAVTGGSAGSGNLFYALAGQSFSSERIFSFPVDADGEYHTYLISLPAGVKGEMASLRFDLNGAAVGDTFKIRAVKFSKSAVPCGYEQTIHAYSDKYHNELRLLYDKDVENLSEFGFEYKIPVDKVASMQFETASGTHNSLSDFDGSTLSYIAFDIKDGGVFGIIIPSDGLTNASLSQSDGYYVFRNFINISGKHRAGSDSIFGHRIYYSAEHSFDGIVREAYIERNPLTVSTQDINAYSKFKYAEYDKVRGAYRFTLIGTNFSEAFTKRQNDYFGGTILFEGDGRYDRKLYVWTNGTAGGLEGAVILDDRMVLTPLQVEVCKNFKGEMEEAYYDPEDTAWGDSYYPLVVKKNETLTHTILNLFQNWGVNKLKQISSISFGDPYYHLSTGVTETNCISPYFVTGRDGWVLPDFRTMSAPLWADQPQHNGVGRLRFFSYVNKNGEKLRSEYLNSTVLSSGMTYADIEYSYRSDCSSFEYTLRHVEFPQDDENRTYYQMDIVVHRDITVADVRHNLTLFDFDGRSIPFRSLSYKAADGQIKDVANDLSGNAGVATYVLSKDSPFFSYYNFSSATNSGTNFGFLVKDYSVTLGGKAWDGNLVLRNSTIGGTQVLNLGEISLDLGDTAFKAGDRISMTFILLPFGVPDQTDDQNVHYVYEDSIQNPWRVKSAEIGTIVPDAYLAIVDCVNNEAQFTVTGGRNANVVRVNGFTNLVKPRLQELVNGEWVDVDFSVHEYDGYQVNYTFDGNYSYSFVIYMEDPAAERTFRVTAPRE